MQQTHWAAGKKFGKELDWSRADYSFALYSAAEKYARNVKGENPVKAADDFIQGALSAEPYDDAWLPEDYRYDRWNDHFDRIIDEWDAANPQEGEEEFPYCDCGCGSRTECDWWDDADL